jgi:ABC-type sugar transport system ATPase subunit
MIELQRVILRAGTFQTGELSFTVAPAEYAVLMGKTGCGKTSVLEAICGLKSVHAGRILLHGKDVTRLKPAQRGIGYVPQDLALFTTMTVRQQLGFALTIRNWEEEDVNARVHELADLLGIGYLLERMPHGLSGGEAQRVAIGRALAYRPDILLLDEPLSALDESTREEMYVLLRSVQKVTRVTTLHVTHSKTEAGKLADRLLLFHNGEIVEGPRPTPPAPEELKPGITPAPREEFGGHPPNPPSSNFRSDHES